MSTGAGFQTYVSITFIFRKRKKYKYSGGTRETAFFVSFFFLSQKKSIGTLGLVWGLVFGSFLDYTSFAA